jgi:glucan phosphoethanolaminetransferase (alkaline phosphatase superfamily)
MKFNKPVFSFLIFIVICSIWTGLLFILPDFLDNPMEGFKGLVITVFHWGLLTATSALLIYLIAINRYVFLVLFPLYSLIGSVLGFFRFAYKATLTPMLVDATLNNDLRTSADLISLELILFVLISISLSAISVWYRFKKMKLKNPLVHLIVITSILILLFSFDSRIKSSVVQRFPYNLYYNLSEYFRLNSQLKVEKTDFDPSFKYDSARNNDSLTVVLVIGESARADHFSLNGYPRQTNPSLENSNNVLSYPKIYSEYTYTNRSLPHLLTRADSASESIAYTEKSFITLFEKCNYRTEWISNQDPADTYIGFMKECDTIIYAHPEKSVYNYNEWLDIDLLPFVAKTLEKETPKNLFILHTIGSHWYYNNHYTKQFGKFQPETKSRVINQNQPEEIINSYDNTILYTDFFLNEIIKMLENKNALMIYIADHGETLGEEGMWLHAGDNDASKNPAFIVWYSDQYKNKYPEKVNALIQNKNLRWRTDFLFHSILSGCNIPSIVIHNDLNIFSVKSD